MYKYRGLPDNTHISPAVLTGKELNIVPPKPICHKLFPCLCTVTYNNNVIGHLVPHLFWQEHV